MTKNEAQELLNTLAQDSERSHQMANAFVGVCVHFKTDSANAGDAIAALLSTAHCIGRRMGLGPEALGAVLQAIATVDPRGESKRVEA
jgi:NAD-dependent oxidoreductase involved in siderophore biosynthesis